MPHRVRGSKFEQWFCLSIALLLASSATGFASQKKKDVSAATSPVFATDKGKLAILLEGHTVGHEEFEIARTEGGWTARGTTDLKQPSAPPAHITGTLVLQPDGTPISYEWTAQTEKKNGAHILFTNGTAKITLEMEGARPCTAEEIKDANRSQPCFFEQNLSFDTPLIAVLDNNLYYQYAVLARLYDWSKRGEQTFSVLIPQDLIPGSVKVVSIGSATADGKPYEGMRISTSDLEINLFLDSSHRLMRLEVPAAKVSVIRE